LHNEKNGCTNFSTPFGGGGLGPQLPSLATPMLYIYFVNVLSYVSTVDRSTRSSPIKRSGTSLASGQGGRHRSRASYTIIFDCQKKSSSDRVDQEMIV